MNEKYINVKINGKEYSFPQGLKIVEACKKIGIYIPTLCFLKEVSEEGSCGICVVEIKEFKNLQRACITEIKDGMEITTDSEKIYKVRKMNLEFILSLHPPECITCESDGDCLLQDLAYKFNIPSSRFFKKEEIIYKETKAWETNPFIKFYPEKCILCRRCVNACKNRAATYAISVEGKGYKIKINTPFELPLEKTDCEFCGICVEACPTGALIEKTRIRKGKIFHFKKTETVCAYCGVGCEIILYTDENNNIVMAKGKEDSPVNRGRLCVKGRYGFEYANSNERLTKPLIKENGNFRETSWEEAINYVAKRLKEIKERCGPDSIVFLSSSRCTNEDNYVLQKFARAVIGTNNIDNCARLCHAPSVAALSKVLGAGAATNPIEDIKNTEVMFVIGSNMTETHPVIAQLVKRHKRNGAKLIVCDPRRINLAEYADIFIQHYPGTDVALLNGIMKVIIDKGYVNKKFIEENTEGFEEFLKVISKYDLELVSKITGVEKNLIEKVAEIYGSAEKAMIFYTMGITQHKTGTDAVLSIANLALLTGHIGSKGNGIMPLRGQANVQGACDMGCLPTYLPGNQRVIDKAAMEKFEKEWNVKLPENPGIFVSELAHHIFSGKIKAMYVMGGNPLMTYPDLNTLEKALKELEFIVVQEIFLSETAEFAHVVLPAASAYEKEGTFTNTERRVQLIRPAREKPEGTKYDWEILSLIAKAMGYKMEYKNPFEIMEEIRRLVPSYAGITYQRLEKGGIQWPCPSEDHPGTEILYEGGKFRTPSGKAIFSPVEFIEPDEMPCEEYPFILTTGRILYHYHGRSETKRVKTLESFVPKNYVEISREDAERLDIKDGELVRVISRRGIIEINAKVSDRPKKGVVFISFHFREANANILTNPILDPVARIPELKVCAVRIEKIEGK
ncbi:MAG: formate dehydrogenase subunit alpha [Candidatus Hydrothermales bacterium]